MKSVLVAVTLAALTTAVHSRAAGPLYYSSRGAQPLLDRSQVNVNTLKSQAVFDGAARPGTARVAIDSRSPVVYIPGVVSSELDAKNSEFPCYTFGRFVKSWLSILRLPLCYDELILEYDVATNTYRNKSGVEIRVPHFGDDEAFVTYQKLVDYLQDEHGYTKKNIRLAPYDWRLAQRELERVGYYNDLKNLIEEMYYDNNNTPVSIIVVSYGGPVSLYFLTSGIVTQEWKDKYIANYIPIGGAWSGGNFMLQLLISSRLGLGENILPIELPEFVIEILVDYLRPLFRSFQSSYYLLPRASLWKDTVLVETPSQKYMANDYERLFRDIGYPEGYYKFHGIEDINLWPPPYPNVPTHCFYGTDVSTPEIFKYSKDFPEITKPTTVEYGEDGDGQVSRAGSEMCLQWDGGSYPFQAHHYRGVHHVDLFQDDDVLREIGDIVHPNTK